MIEVVVDAHLGLLRVEPAEPAGVLDDRPPPRDGQSEEESVQARVVQAFADVATGGEHEPLLVFWDHRETVKSCTALPCSDSTLQHDDVTCEASKVVRQIFQVVPTLRQHVGDTASVN